MNIAYFDCFAGAAGDMIAGALLDAGLPLSGYRLDVSRVSRRGVHATKVDVIVNEKLADSQFQEVAPGEHPGHHHAHHDHGHHHEHRPLRAILDLLAGSPLTPAVRDMACRIFRRLGEAAAEAVTEPVTELMANIDDMNPQVFEHLVDLLFAAGALDVWLAPVQMKKHRPGTVLHELARPEQADALSHVILAESATLGVRRQELARIALERSFQTVQTAWGEVRIKVGRQAGRVLNLAPDTRTAANWPNSTACRSRGSWPPPRRRRRPPSVSVVAFITHRGLASEQP